MHAFVHNFLARNLPLDLLVNNAGTAIMPDDTTEDGFEVGSSPVAYCVLYTCFEFDRTTLLLHFFQSFASQASVYSGNLLPLLVIWYLSSIAFVLRL